MTAIPLDLSELLTAAIVDRFFAPQVSGVDFVPGGYSPGGQPSLTPVPRMSEAPMAAVARHIYDTRRDDIIAAVLERLTLDEVAEAVAVKVVETLNSTRGPFSGDRDPVALTRLRVEVDQRVAEGLAADQLGKLRAPAVWAAAEERTPCPVCGHQRAEHVSPGGRDCEVGMTRGHPCGCQGPLVQAT